MPEIDRVDGTILRPKKEMCFDLFTATFMYIYLASHPFCCGLCRQAYGRKPSLMKHLLSHNPKLWCSLCGKGLTDKQELTRHMAVHTGQKTEECVHCLKRLALGFIIHIYYCMRYIFLLSALRFIPVSVCKLVYSFNLCL